MKTTRHMAPAFVALLPALLGCSGGNAPLPGTDADSADSRAPETDASDSGDSSATGEPLSSDTGSGSDGADDKNGGEVFDETKVRSVRLTLTDADLADLNDFSKLVKNNLFGAEVVVRYFPAQLDYDGMVLDKVGVRYKGDQSISACINDKGHKQVKVMEEYGGIDICAKFSLKLDFNKYDAAGRLDGLKKLNLHAMAADPSKMHEMLGYRLFREMEVPASRTAYVRLFVNDEPHGLYLAVEEVDGRFTAQRFPASGDGNVYKEVWPEKDKSQAAFVEALRTNDEPDIRDVSDIIALRDALAAATPASFASDLEGHLDFDELARYIVVDRAIANFDGIMVWYGAKVLDNIIGAYNHNYYWYHDQESGRFLLIPWDLDKAFIFPEPIFWSNNEPEGPYHLVPNWNVETKSCSGYNMSFDPGDFGPYGVREIDCDKLLRLTRETVFDRLAALTEDFNSSLFEQSRVTELVGAWRSAIASAVAEDATIDEAHWEEAVESFLADLPRHRENVDLMMSELISP